MQIKHLKLGLIGLSQSIDSNCPFGTGRGWFSGHWPCAIIAAYYFCKNNPLEKGVEKAITLEVDKLIDTHSDLFLIKESSHQNEIQNIDQIIEELKGSITNYMVSGHNVIYGAFAIKVLSENKDLATPEILQGIFDLIQYFKERKQRTNPEKFFKENNRIYGNYNHENNMVFNVFSSLQSANRVIDKNRILFDGHLLTHAHALTMLSKMGYSTLAKTGFDSHQVHMVESHQLQYAQFNERQKEKVTAKDHPFTLAFWERDFQSHSRQWEYGHVFKFLYSFYDLTDRIDDPNMINYCEQQLNYLI